MGRHRQLVRQLTRLLVAVDKPLIEQEIVPLGSDDRYLDLFAGRTGRRMKAVVLAAITASEPYHQVWVLNILHLQFG